MVTLEAVIRVHIRNVAMQYPIHIGLFNTNVLRPQTTEHYVAAVKAISCRLLPQPQRQQVRLQPGARSGLLHNWRVCRREVWQESPGD